MDRVATDIDVRLVERFARGEEAAFDALVARHRRPIFNLVLHMVGDQEAADDVALEVFFQAYLSLPSYRREAHFSTWLRRIAINVALQYLRQPRIKQAATEIALADEGSLVGEDVLGLVLSKEITGQVITAMQELPQKQRAAVILYYLEERTYGEIAEILDIPVATARTRIFHGTKLLKEKLRALGIVPAKRGAGT